MTPAQDAAALLASAKWASIIPTLGIRKACLRGALRLVIIYGSTKLRPEARELLKGLK